MLWTSSGTPQAVQVPGIAVIQLLLQPTHLLQQLIGVLRGQLGCDLVVPPDELFGLGDALLHVAEHRLALVQHRFLRQDSLV
jgi:hypothetical protein